MGTGLMKAESSLKIRSEEGIIHYPSRIKARKGYVTIVDDDQKHHLIKESDLMSW